LRFDEQEEDAAPGGWFSPVQKSSPGHAEAGQEPDYGGVRWFGQPHSTAEPQRPTFEEPRPTFETQRPTFEPARPSFQPSAESRGPRSETAAHLWAEVTRGGTPAGTNPNRGPSPLPDRWAGPDDPFGPGEFAPRADDVPFRGARRVDVSAAPAAPPRRPSATGRPSASGAVNGYAGSPSGGKPRQSESGALRRLRENGAMRSIMDTNAMRSIMDTAAMQILRERFARRGRLIASIVAVAWLAASVAVVLVVTSHNGHRTPKASPSSAATVSTGVAGPGISGTAPASPRPSARPSKTVRRTTARVATLPVASVVAFGPGGTSDGDNPATAAFIIAGNGTKPWQTKWYGTAHFGSLQPGTGLLLDMGKKVTVTKVTLDLAAGGADVIIRVGNSPVPGTFTEIAHGIGIGGTASLQAGRAASGRYVEVWFTLLPQDASGTYQETVYGVQVTGRPYR
jgi:hypothetical protein